MAKKDFSPPDTETKKISDDSAQNLIEQMQIELAKFGLKLVEDDDNPNKIKIKTLENVQDTTTQIWINKLRIELIKLGLKAIEDIDGKRVTNPKETYNSLVALYNAVKGA